ncbi:Na+/H+ antiporter NhaC family protein, partial [Clostridium sp. UBA3887]
IAGGACFGDNIGLISDTTVVSSGIQDVEVIDRVRTQGVWSLSCMIITAILIFVVSLAMKLPTDVANAKLAIDAIP